jgi:hypothetical protein
VHGHRIGGHDGVMSTDSVLDGLRERCRRDHAAWINGDGSAYRLPDVGTIFGAVGGVAAGGPETAARQQSVAAQWLHGEGEVEFLNGGVAGDVAWLAFIERGVVELAGDAAGLSRRWDLRVTEVFVRIEEEWRRMHRHADPLVDRRSVLEAADLLH